jgi:TfoX/Sxy family transcriptional regulator of competence genes
LLERLRRLLDGRPGIVEKPMVGGRSFSLHGRMFCGATRGGLMVRVGREAVAAAAAEPHVGAMTLGGKQLAAFVVVAPEGIASDEVLERWVRRGLDAVPVPAEAASSPKERYADLVSVLTRHDDVDPPGTGRGFGSGALTVRGSIFAMLPDDRLVVKLPAARVAELIESGDGRPFTAGKDKPMREWVEVVGDDVATWAALAEEARAFVRR